MTNTAFTHTAEQRNDARFAADILSSSAPLATVVRGVRAVQAWKADGAKDTDIVVILEISKRKMEALAHVARLAKMVKSDEDPTGILECGTLLQNNGQTTSISRPSGVLKDMEKAGKSFASWGAARKALETVLAAQNPTNVNEDAEDEGESEGEDEGNGGIAGAPTLESEAAKIGQMIFDLATTLKVDTADVIDAVLAKVDTLEQAAAVIAAA
jgi:hypothetical protein